MCLLAVRHRSRFVVATYLFGSAEKVNMRKRRLTFSPLAQQHKVQCYQARSKALFIFPQNRLISDGSVSSLLLFVCIDRVYKRKEKVAISGVPFLVFPSALMTSWIISLRGNVILTRLQKGKHKDEVDPLPTERGENRWSFTQTAQTSRTVS